MAMRATEGTVMTFWIPSPSEMVEPSSSAQAGATTTSATAAARIPSIELRVIVSTSLTASFNAPALQEHPFQDCRTNGRQSA